MNFSDSMKYINSFSHSGKKVEDLSRISGLLKLLGNPQKKLEFIHIAGTNGKGSTVEYCSGALIRSGYKTGQFTSPYIISYCDRIRINGKNIPEQKAADICTKVKEAVMSDYYSQFEISLAIALLYFLEEKCDIVVLETGIGGTLDATNIIENPLVSVITSVSLDHTAILGNTAEEIAVHKLGIIKPHCPAVLSCNNKDTVKNLARVTAKEKNSTLVIPDEKEIRILRSDLHGTDFLYKNEEYRLKMCGKHQIVNAVTAIETLALLSGSFAVTRSAVKSSLSETSLSSRIEVIAGNPDTIIDGGHNEAGIDSLLDILEQCGIVSVTAIFGMVKGKAADHAVSRLSRIIKKVYCTDGYIENNIPAHCLAEKFQSMGVESEACGCGDAPGRALSFAKENNTPLLVCGSLYLASEVRKYLQK
ncbi:MAG: bifunctional folylpolyglutamate synthase/dihydrofolate synthase [Porcipelethomonas sp.]